MEFTNLEIYNAKEPFTRLMQNKFPVLVSYGLAKIAAQLEAHHGVIEQVREQLIMTHGEAMENMPTAKGIKPGDKNFPQFAKEYDILLRQKVDIEFEVVELPLKVATTCNQCHQITEKDLEIEPYILVVLDKFIKVAEPVSLIPLRK